MSNTNRGTLATSPDSQGGHPIESVGKNPDTDQLRSVLIEALERMCDAYNYSWNGKNKVIGAAKLLTSMDCERKIKYLLEHPLEKEVANFDPYYAQKSLFCTSFVLDHLKRRLAENGFEVSIATEVRSILGVYDVVIKVRKPRESTKTDSVSLRLEVKGSLGLPLDEISRYLWENSPLVLIRVIPGHVVILKGADLRSFVEMSMQETTAKAFRLTEDKGMTVPGRYCRDCPEISCPHNWHKQDRRGDLISMGDAEFQRDIRSLFQHLPHLAEMTAAVVMEELGRPLWPGDMLSMDTGRVT